jgi:L-iditol 2-dehydrogenase
MKALVLYGPYDIRLEEVVDPVPEEDEVLICVKACAVCGSDVHGFDGSNSRRIPPVIMGHEASGVIVDSGKKVSGWKIGDRVTFDSTEYCGKCWHCRNGSYNLCENRKIIGVSCDEYKKQGAMAEFITVKAHMLYSLPKNVSFREACLCEPLSVGMHAVGISGLKKTDSVLIIGAGTIGLMTLLAAKSCTEGAIFVSARYEHQKKLALGMGASSAEMRADELRKQIFAATDGRGADIVYDTVGTQESFDTAFHSVRTGGTIVCIGNNKAYVNFPLQECVVRQIAVLGSYSSAGEFANCLNCIAQGQIDLAPFLEHVYRLDEGKEVFRALTAKKPPLLKAIFENPADWGGEKEMAL